MKLRQSPMADKKPLLFTCSLDDGHPSDMKAFALLQRHGIDATFYAPIKNREGARILSRADLREIAACFEIGSHTYDHTALPTLDPALSRFQVVEGKKKLEDILGHKIPGFCYPAGKYRMLDVDIVKNAGFEYARTTINLCFDNGSRIFEMPTTMQFYPHSQAVYLRNFIRAGRWPSRMAGLRIALAHEDWIRRLYALFEHACQQGGVFHLWGHAKDIDELNAWQKFDQFLGYVATRVAPEHRLNNGNLARQLNSALPSRHPPT